MKAPACSIAVQMPDENAIPALVLASQSRYRRELLERLRIPFSWEKPQLDEEAVKSALLADGTKPQDLAQKLAHAKAASLAQSRPDVWVLASDQLLSFQGEILGKNPTRDTAISCLTKLSGQSHELITAWTLLKGPNEICSGVHISRIRMRQLSAPEIERYVDHEQPFDSAGSYKMESLGISLVDAIDTTDFTAIIGLPLIELTRHLRQIGFNVP